MTAFNGATGGSDGDGLHSYLRRIHKVPMLSAHEELELSQRWRMKRDNDAAALIVASHLRLAAKIALRYRNYGVPLSDLISEGNIGLMEAVKRFDPDLGFRFASYARWWIRAAIQAHVLQNWSLVKVGTTLAYKRIFFNLRRLESRMQITHRHELQPEHATTIADALGVSPQAVVSMRCWLNGRDRSMAAPIAPDRRLTLEDSLVDPDNLEDLIGEEEEAAVQRAMLPVALRSLDPRQRQILIERRLKEEPTKLEDLALRYRVSAERVRQIEVRAFQKLRKTMRMQMSSRDIGCAGSTPDET
jgi:RNA polymerase sigma-32 factor